MPVHGIRPRNDDEHEKVVLQFPSSPREADTAAKRFVVEEQARTEAANSNAAPSPPPPGRERRKAAEKGAADHRAGMTPAQLDALSTLEQFRWTLRYVRRPLFRAPIPILFSPAGDRFIVIDEDGSINENPGFKLRP